MWMSNINGKYCHNVAFYIIHPAANGGNPHDCFEYHHYGNASELNHIFDISLVAYISNYTTEIVHSDIRIIGHM